MPGAQLLSVMVNLITIFLLMKAWIIPFWWIWKTVLVSLSNQGLVFWNDQVFRSTFASRRSFKIWCYGQLNQFGGCDFKMRVLGSLDVFPRLLSWTQDQCQLLYCQQNPSWRSTEGSVCAVIIWSWSIVLLGPIELITSLLQNVTHCTSLSPILWRDTSGWSAVSGQAVAWIPRLTKEKWTSAGGTAIVQRFLVLLKRGPHDYVGVSCRYSLVT